MEANNEARRKENKELKTRNKEKKYEYLMIPYKKKMVTTQ